MQEFFRIHTIEYSRTSRRKVHPENTQKEALRSSIEGGELAFVGGTLQGNMFSALECIGSAFHFLLNVNPKF